MGVYGMFGNDLERKSQRWSEEEDATLRDLLAAGYSYALIAEWMRRTPKSIAARAKLLKERGADAR